MHTGTPRLPASVKAFPAGYAKQALALLCDYAACIGVTRRLRWSCPASRGRNTTWRSSAVTLVSDQSGTQRVPGVQAEDHLPPGRLTGRRVRVRRGRQRSWLPAVDVVAPRRTMPGGAFPFGWSRQATVTTGNCQRQATVNDRQLSRQTGCRRKDRRQRQMNLWRSHQRRNACQRAHPRSGGPACRPEGRADRDRLHQRGAPARSGGRPRSGRGCPDGTTPGL
jgi:hypothetical protein